ncbi:ATPase [Synechococcus sp. ATX 2A4]|uniref:ATPase n=1 Tax=Synechococcus sp. ATX 2A4 TaxID=2823727 RepID=UPI0020CE0796|nr:ATPase [Synechococcus sp. ATX 2A4]MCP9885073.1 ATPase [Synechococcus sp. ATX 2A4]
MTRVLLISGPPGCGKTSWILNQLQAHRGPCGYLRLEGFTAAELQQAPDGGIDRAFLVDQCPGLLDLAEPGENPASRPQDLLALIELPQWQAPPEAGLAGIDPRLLPPLEALQLLPQRHLSFGRDAELPAQDTLQFNALEAWSLDLTHSVWDPPSLNSFWFELVNGAYGEVYRAKALMNLPDGRSFFFNWIVSQEGTQFLPLERVAPPVGRPQRMSRLVVQGKHLDAAGIEATIADGLLSDAVLELQQAPQRPFGAPLPATR